MVNLKPVSFLILVCGHNHENPIAVDFIFCAVVDAFIFVVVDFPIDFRQVYCLDHPKIMLSVWVIVFGKIPMVHHQDTGGFRFYFSVAWFISVLPRHFQL